VVGREGVCEDNCTGYWEKGSGLDILPRYGFPLSYLINVCKSSIRVCFNFIKSPHSKRLTDKILFNSMKSRSEEHTSELQSRFDLVCRLLLEKKKSKQNIQK